MDTSRTLRMWNFRTGVVAALISLLVGAGGEPALAHSFNLAIFANGTSGPAELRSAVQGALTASAEMDGHPDETADGHLGGLDVFLIPLPGDAARGIEGLVGQDAARLDFLVPLEHVSADLTGLPGVTGQTVVVSPGDLPDRAAWLKTRAANADSFAAWYRQRFGEDPDAYAAQGYIAARMIDYAVRENNGISNPEELRKALDAGRQRTDW